MSKEVMDKLAELEAKIEKLSSVAGFRVEWSDKTTDSGVQIQNGPTTVKRTGSVIGTFGFPAGPQTLVLMFVVKRDGDDHIVTINAPDCKFIK